MPWLASAVLAAVPPLLGTADPGAEGIDLGGDLVLPPEDARGPAPPPRGPRPAGGAPAPHLLYLNFSDGSETVTLAPTDRASDNRSAVGGAAPFPPFGWQEFADLGATRALVTGRLGRAVHEMFAPYDVLLTLARPAQGDYTMALVGGGPEALGLPPSVTGVAVLDCDNRQPANLVFAFSDNVAGNPHGLAVTLAQELAHALGLEHTSDERDIMYPRIRAAQEGFLDQTSLIWGSPVCGGTTQNSDRRLRGTVGEWPAGLDKPFLDGPPEDREPPTVSIDEPQAGATLGPSFAIRASAHDDVALARLELDVGSEHATLGGPPWQWVASHLPEGPVEITVTAWDGAGRSSVAGVAVTVAGLEPRAVPGGCRVGPSAGPGRPAGPAGPAGSVLALGVGLWALACTKARRRI